MNTGSCTGELENHKKTVVRVIKRVKRHKIRDKLRFSSDVTTDEINRIKSASFSPNWLRYVPFSCKTQWKMAFSEPNNFIQLAITHINSLRGKKEIRIVIMVGFFLVLRQFLRLLMVLCFIALLWLLLLFFPSIFSVIIARNCFFFCHVTSKISNRILYAFCFDWNFV